MQWESGKTRTENVIDSAIGGQAIDTMIQILPHPLSGIVFDSSLIPGFMAQYPAFKEFATDISTFYRNRSYNYAWYEKNGVIEPVSVLLDQLNQESIDGVAITTPYKDSLQEMFHFSDFTERPEHIKPAVNS